ncbi:MAG: hypothetical protein KDD53_02325 [Bdellovibrionales bacterium]|nr:hypothetical protein [Bdellovibrionales bacterium]
MSKLAPFALILLGIILVCCSPAAAETFVNSWLEAVEIESEIKTYGTAVADFAAFNNRNSGRIEYEPTGQVFDSYAEIKQDLSNKKERLAEKLIKYSEATGASPSEIEELIRKAVVPTES